MNNLNVFNVSFSPMKYPSNWLPNVRTLGRMCKWAYQRITRGFSDYDAYDLDSYYLDLFYASLNHLADVSHGWPQSEEFPEFKNWQKYVKDMAMDFYRANENNGYYPTPCEEKWYEDIKDKPLASDSKYSSAMLNEAEENQRKRDIDLQNGLTKLSKVFRSLWD